jgi:hypothetical protein
VPRVNSQRARLATHEFYSVTRSNSRDGLRKRLKMNAICERVIGTMRRECLDRLSPLSASHLCFIPRSVAENCTALEPYRSAVG